MKCPECSNGKGKGKRKVPSLRTVRTMANGRTARRERVCPRCKGRWWTRELYEEDYKAEFERREVAVGEAAQERDAARGKLASVSYHLNALLMHAQAE